MIRFLLNIAIQLVMAVVAFLVAGWLVTGVNVQPMGFIVAVLVFTAAQTILGPFVFNVGRKYASAILGGIGLVSTLLALWIATLFSDGIQIEGVTAWVITSLVVWLITALGTWILGYLILQRWWDRRKEAKHA
jgi:uncharacterized membrane protein YvlD (DUF360 family)